MAWVFDHGELSQQATGLRSAADQLAATRATILNRLGTTGRYSGSADALAGTVSAMRARATDLDARVLDLDRMATLVQQRMGLSTFRSALAAPPPPSEEERLVDLLAAVLEELQGSTASPTDSVFWRLEIRRAILSAQLRSHREGLLAEALENRTVALTIGASGSWVEVMLDASEAEIVRLSAALDIGREDLLEVAIAMRSGISPEEAGLPEYLFPKRYLTRREDAEVLEAQIAEAREELERFREDTWLARWDMEDSDGVMGSIVLRDSDYRAKERAFHAAEDAEAEAATRLEELEARYSDLTSPVSRAATAEFLDQVPFLVPVDRSRLVGEFLGTEWLVAYDDFASSDEYREILDLLPDAVGSAGFFNTLGPASTYLTANVALTAFGHDQEEAEALIGRLSVALGDASRSGELEFSGADLINGKGVDPLIHSAVHPAWLFTYGDFSDPFLLSAAVAAVAQGEVAANTGMQFYTTEYDLENNLPAIVDARIMVMQRLADRPELSARLLIELDQAGLLGGFLDAEFRDDGVAAGDILANVLDVSGSDGLEATAVTVSALAAIESDGDAVDEGVAVGAAAMVAPHIDSFVPSVERQKELGTLYIPGELPTGELRAHLDGAGVDSQATLEALMHVVLGEATAAELFMASTLTFNVATLQSVADPSQPDGRHQYTNDLAGLDGLTSAIWIDEHLSDASDEDARNAAAKRWTGLLTSAAVTTGLTLFAPATIAGSTVALAVAKFGVGQTINLGVKELYLGEVFPTNNLEQAQMEAITSLTERDPYGYAVLQALSNQGALVDGTSGEVVDLSERLADLGAIDNHSLGELLSSLVVIDPATGLPSEESEPIDWYTGGAFLTVQEITEVVGHYLEE